MNIHLFDKAAGSHLPDIHSLPSPIDKILWVLWVAKDVGESPLDSLQISQVLREIYEINIHPTAIDEILKKVGDEICIHNKGKFPDYEIMREGKDYLTANNNGLQLFYFEPNKKFTSQRILSNKILDNLKGELNIVDPYCGSGALDVLHGKNRTIRFLTNLDNLGQNDKDRMVREIKKFKAENVHVEFRDYPAKDIHDRYIISDDALVLLGHGMGDLGGKESFAIVLNKAVNENIFEAMDEAFNRRWKQATVI